MASLNDGPATSAGTMALTKGNVIVTVQAAKLA
jgi:hypothetical protein